jgi:methionyl aminopeptidase
MSSRNKPGSAPIVLKTPEQIELIRQSALLVSRTLGEVAKLCKPGVSTGYLDKIAEEFIRDNGGEPGFKGLYDCPSTLLTSVNEQVVHGLPGNYILQEGDIISVDCGVKMNGYYGDHAYTLPVGPISPEKQRLLDITKEALYLGIREAYVGNRMGTLSYTIQRYCEKNGYSVVRELIGHGLGTNLHEGPEVPNFGSKGIGVRIEEGMTLAIEPMVNMGRKEIVTLSDKWTIVTRDRKPSAHFEHDIAVVDGKPVILSTFDYVEDVLGIPRSTANMGGVLAPAST